MNDVTPLPDDELALARALVDVPVPVGLEARLLAAVSEPEVSPKVAPPTSSRRAWLVSAAGLTGLLALGGYAYRHRQLGHEEVVVGTRGALSSMDWVLPWRSMSKSPAGFPLPPQLKLPRGWQYQTASWADETVAFDVTLPGGRPAVLFVAKVHRDISHLPSVPGTLAVQSQAWSRVDVWQASGVLYVLAAQGSEKDYEALFVNAVRSGLA